MKFYKVHLENKEAVFECSFGKKVFQDYSPEKKVCLMQCEKNYWGVSCKKVEFLDNNKELTVWEEVITKKSKFPNLEKELQEVKPQSINNLDKIWKISDLRDKQKFNNKPIKKGEREIKKEEYQEIPHSIPLLKTKKTKLSQKNNDGKKQLISPTKEVSNKSKSNKKQLANSTNQQPKNKQKNKIAFKKQQFQHNSQRSLTPTKTFGQLIEELAKIELPPKNIKT